jgi:hypothetical protein
VQTVEEAAFVTFYIYLNVFVGAYIIGEPSATQWSMSRGCILPLLFRAVG